MHNCFGCGVQMIIGKQLKQVLDVEPSVRIGFLAHVRFARLLMQCRLAELLRIVSCFWSFTALRAAWMEW